MNEFYRIPALVLLSMLLVVFALLYLRARTIRNMLWLVGWGMVVLNLALEIAHVHQPGIGLAVENSGLVLGALMFLGSMSPLRLKHWPRILYVYAFAVPLLLYTALVSLQPAEKGPLHVAAIILAVITVYSAVLWSIRDHLIPIWFTTLFSVAVGGVCLWLTYNGEYFFVMYLAKSGCNFITALLFIVAYRRFSPGVIFTSAGLLLWTSPVVLDFILPGYSPPMILVARATNLIKVMTAIGMVLIVLEEELAQNQAAKERDHRARVEMERYSEIDLSLLSGVHTDAAYQHACEVIAQASRFSQVVLYLKNVEDEYHIAAHAGMQPDLVAAWEALGKRMRSEHMKTFSQNTNIAVEMGNPMLVDLRPLFLPNDPLEQLQYDHTHALPLVRRGGQIDGAFFLSGLKRPEDSLQADDLLPLQLLAARLTAIREHDALMQRVARSERLAGLGQLAAGVAHELNNPLTVVLGYSQLMEDALESHPSREMVTQIRNAAQRMRQVLESTLRFWRPSSAGHEPVSIAEILRDLQRLQRPEFDRRQAKLILHMPDDLRPIQGNRSQLQQMFLQLLQHSLAKLEEDKKSGQHTIRLDVTQQAEGIKILVSDNGPGFANPGQAFDPYFHTRWTKNSPDTDLSICYAIVRGHGGEISAHNLEPYGGALMIELPYSQKRSSFVDGN